MPAQANGYRKPKRSVKRVAILDIFFPFVSLSKDCAAGDEGDMPKEAWSVLGERKRSFMIVPFSLIVMGDVSTKCQGVGSRFG
jgi:hypothetical protein